MYIPKEINLNNEILTCTQFANTLSKAAYPRAGGLHYAIYLGVLFTSRPQGKVSKTY